MHRSVSGRGRSRPSVRAWWHVVAGPGAILLHLLLVTAVEHGVLGGIGAGSYLDAFRFLLPRYGPTSAVHYVLIAVGYHLAMASTARARSRREAELSEAQRAEAELRALRMQINPHFLFNCLNSTASLVEAGETAAASDSLALLGDLLRTMTRRGDAHTVPLSTELDFVRAYLELERMRFPDGLAVEYAVDPTVGKVEVPVWVLQPLVENAIRHGFDGGRGGGRLRVACQRSGDSLHLTVEDDGPGFGAARSGRQGTRVGLRNVRARVERIFGPMGRLEIGRSDLGGARVRIVLPTVDGDAKMRGEK